MSGTNSQSQQHSQQNSGLQSGNMTQNTSSSQNAGHRAPPSSAMHKFPTPLSTLSAAKQQVFSGQPGQYLKNNFPSNSFSNNNSGNNASAYQQSGLGKDKLNKSGYSLAAHLGGGGGGGGGVSTNASLSDASTMGSLNQGLANISTASANNNQAQSSTLINNGGNNNSNNKRKFGAMQQGGVILPPMQSNGSNSSSLPPKRTPNHLNSQSGGRMSRQAKLNSIISSSSSSQQSKQSNKSDISLTPLVTGNNAMNSLSLSSSNTPNSQIIFPKSPTEQSSHTGAKFNNMSRLRGLTTTGSGGPKSLEMSSVLSGLPSFNAGGGGAINPFNSAAGGLGGMNIDPTKIILPKHQPTKCSTKRNGIIRSYAANTNQGIIRVSIILNIMKPQNKQCEKWPKCSFFGVYDGHGGASCADYLRDNLHHFVVKDEAFPSNPRQALKSGFAKAQSAFLQLAEKKAQTNPALLDKSGSCAVAILLVEDVCFVANVGDSRAILSSDQGRKAMLLTKDHRPSEEDQQKRIIEYGGKIYQTQTMAKIPTTINGIQIAKNQFLVGPYRVLPGRLSVSRTFGDIQAKLSKYGGKYNVISSAPQIIAFKIRKEHDFIVLACDGIFDKMTSGQCIKTVWATIHNNHLRQQNVHQQCGISIEMILKTSVARKTLDNITAVMVSFLNFKRALQSLSQQQTQHSQPSSFHQYSQYDINASGVPNPAEIYMPDEKQFTNNTSTNAQQSDYGRGRFLSSSIPGGDQEDDQTPIPKLNPSKQQNYGAASLPKNQSGSFQNFTPNDHDRSNNSSFNNFTLRSQGQRVPPSASNQSDRGSLASGYQRKFLQGSSKSTIRPRGMNKSGLSNLSSNFGPNSDDQTLHTSTYSNPHHNFQNQLGNHNHTSLSNAPPTLRTPIHSRHLATIDNPYSQGVSPAHSKLMGILGNNNSGSGANLISNLNSSGGAGSLSPKRGIISSSATKKSNGPLLSRGSHMSGGTAAFDRSQIIGNSYSPLARRNSQRRDATLSASSQLGTGTLVRKNNFDGHGI